MFGPQPTTSFSSDTLAPTHSRGPESSSALQHIMFSPDAVCMLAVTLSPLTLKDSLLALVFGFASQPFQTPHFCSVTPHSTTRHSPAGSHRGHSTVCASLRQIPSPVHTQHHARLSLRARQTTRRDCRPPPPRRASWRRLRLSVYDVIGISVYDVIWSRPAVRICEAYSRGQK